MDQVCVNGVWSWKNTEGCELEIEVDDGKREKIVSLPMTEEKKFLGVVFSYYNTYFYSLSSVDRSPFQSKTITAFANVRHINTYCRQLPTNLSRSEIEIHTSSRAIM